MVPSWPHYQGGLALRALTLPILVASATPLMLVMGWSVLAVIGPINTVAFLAYRLLLFPRTLQGRVNSVFQMLVIVGSSCSLGIGGVFLQGFGPHVILWLIALGLGIYTIVGIFSPLRAV